MAEQPVITLDLGFDRLPEAAMRPFLETPSGPVSDAAGRHLGAPVALKPVTRAARFCGSALTIATARDSNLGVWAALEHVRPGDVLVIAAGGGGERAVIGDLLAGYAFNAGAAAIVTDGMVRDVEALEAFGKPVFAAGAIPVGPFKHGPASVGLPVALGAQQVASGDVIVGDRDGLAVVPAGMVAEAAAELAAIQQREAAMEAEIAAGAKVPSKAAEVLAAAQVVRAQDHG